MSGGKNKKPSSGTAGRSEGKRRNHEIIGMLNAGVSAREVAQKFKLSYSEAKKLCLKLRLTGDRGRTPGTGRKRKATKRSDHFIAECSNSDTPSKKEITNELRTQTRVEVSTKTIQCVLREKEILGERSERSHMLARKNRLARLKFAREHVGWSIEQWKRVVWSDESPFALKTNLSSMYGEQMEKWVQDVEYKALLNIRSRSMCGGAFRGMVSAICIG